MTDRLKIIKELEEFENDHPNIKEVNQELKDRIKNSDLDEKFKPTAETMSLAINIIGMIGHKYSDDGAQLYLIKKMLDEITDVIQQYMIACVLRKKNSSDYKEEK